MKGGTPRLTPRGDEKKRLGVTKKSGSRGQKGRLRMTKKARGDIPHPVVPRHASAEGPLASLGVTKKDVRGDKKKDVRGDKKEALGLTKWAQG